MTLPDWRKLAQETPAPGRRLVAMPAKVRLRARAEDWGLATVLARAYRLPVAKAEEQGRVVAPARAYQHPLPEAERQVAVFAWVEQVSKREEGALPDG